MIAILIDVVLLVVLWAACGFEMDTVKIGETHYKEISKKSGSLVIEAVPDGK